MNDPGLPPRPRSLNLLESLVKEEEAKAQTRGSADVVIPTESRDSVTPEFYDVDKQQLTKETSASKSYTEFKMKGIDNISKGQKGNPLAGFKGKKFKKQRSRSNSGDRFKSKNVTRPFSADYSQNKRSKISVTDKRNSRPKTTKGRRTLNRTSSPKGQRPRSPHSYSSDTYSSDDEYIKKEKFRSDSNSSQDREKKDDYDDFYDSGKGSDKRRHRRSTSSSSSSSSQDQPERRNDNDKDGDRKNNRARDSRASSSSSESSTDDNNKRDQNKQVNGNIIYGDLRHRIGKKVKKTVYSDKHGKQRTRSDSESSDHQRMVVVDDYSSTISSSEDESKNRENVKVNNSKPPLLKPEKKKKPLLSRKKREGYKIFQIDPDLYLEGKLHQKYTELEELVSCSFVDQKSHVTRHHLYQMELLRDQYQNASHGLRAAGTIIPRSLPGEIRNRSTRPTSAKVPSRRTDSDLDSVNYDNAYGTLRSVMSAERARKSHWIRTDILADRPSSGKKSMKKKKKIDATYKAGKSDTEEDISERPSFSSKTDSKASSSPRTPRSGPSVDDHIKYSKNEKLKKWLKEKDKIYRQHVKEERKKKREEREKLVNEANEKFERRIKSQKEVKKWMKEKNKEWIKFQKEKQKKEKEDDEWLESYKKTKSVPGDSLQIRPQSAPTRRSENYEKDNHDYGKDKILRKREKEEENKEAKLTQEGPHPPQTKFIYKRPVAGKIKLKMEVRGKSPVGKKADAEGKEDNGGSEKERAKQMRLSYDEWVKKKRSDDATKKKNAERQRELTKSDPELERIIPALGKKRIEDKLNMRKRIDTGIKKFDDKTNKSFGGADFDGETTEDKERPRSAYRLESSNTAPEEQPFSIKQIQRPSTAPSGRGKVPSPQKSAKSPRKAIIPQRVDKVMTNEDTSNPYQLPFSPEKGIPPYVADRQKKLFADHITSNLDEIEQRALLNAELIKEGVSDADIKALSQQKEYEGKEQDNILEATEEDKHPKITELMYSPRKKEESSESSSDENGKEETKYNEDDQNKTKEETEITKIVNSNGDNDTNYKENVNLSEREEQIKDEDNINQEPKSENGHSHYKTYDNLNELTLDSESKNENLNDHLKEDIEQLKKRVENLHLHSDLPDLHPERQNVVKHDESATSEITEDVKITVISHTDSDPNIVGILKESKRENIPVPESSEEPVLRQKDSDVIGEEPGSPQEDLGNSRKRVSFNEQAEVFQSYESSSTDTVTPEQEEFDAQAESLDAQQGYDIENDEDEEDDRPDILKLQGQKMTINIGGFELNPTIIKPGGENDDEARTDGESKATFITEPDNSSGGSD